MHDGVKHCKCVSCIGAHAGIKIIVPREDDAGKTVSNGSAGERYKMKATVKPRRARQTFQYSKALQRIFCDVLVALPSLLRNPAKLLLPFLPPMPRPSPAVASRLNWQAANQFDGQSSSAERTSNFIACQTSGSDTQGSSSQIGNT